MKKTIITTMVAVAALVTLISCNLIGRASDGESALTAQSDSATEAAAVVVEEVEEQPAASAIPLGAQALIAAYPDFVKGYENGNIVFVDGSTMVYDDGKKKDFLTMLDNSDIEDMFFTPYVDNGGTPEYLADAGRSRCDQLFKKMYGNSEGAVRSTLVNVNWMGQTVKFTKVNGAAEQLAKVAAEIAQYPELKKYLASSGTFYWRKVRGANRMSAHSYGIAFDIGVPNSDYWLWKNPNAKETDKIAYANRFPHKIAEIFRKHGFIWGGAWYHFDTMHFEYRPEILGYAELVEQQGAQQ